MNGHERSQLDTVLAKIDTLEAKVDLLLERDERAREMLLDHEARLRKNEAWRYSLPATLLLAFSALVAAVFRG